MKTYYKYHNPKQKATIIVAAVFALVAAALAFIVFRRWYRKEGKSTLTRLVRDVQGKSGAAMGNTKINNGVDVSSILDEDNDPLMKMGIGQDAAPSQGEMSDMGEASLVPLRSNEVFLSSVSADIDGDTFPDQVLAINRVRYPNGMERKEGAGASMYGDVIIVFVRYDSASNLYTRVAESPVASSLQNISLSAMDMTGDHNMEIIVHGNIRGRLEPLGQAGTSPSSVEREGTARQSSAAGQEGEAGQSPGAGQSPKTMRFLPAGAASMIVFATGKSMGKKIGDFTADSVYTDTADRTASYNMSQTAGEPYHVWTYQNETQSGGGETRTEWNYSAKEGKYVAIAHQRLAASDIKEREMAHIRSSMSSFSGFLNGLWCRESNTDGERFVYFDKRAREIIFVYQDIEELYLWGAGGLHGRGCVITTTNAAIKTMHRRLDVAVTDSDEISIRIFDDVRIVRNDTSAWDGTYRKMTPGSRLPQAHPASAAE